APPERANVTLRDVGQFERVLGREVRERVHLQMRPGSFDRVQLRRVGRKELNVKVAGPPEHPSDRTASMNVEPIPNENDRTLDLAPEIAHEVSEPFAIDISIGPDRKVEADPTPFRRDGQRTNDRCLLAVAAGLRQDRGTASWRPGPAHERCEKQPALIEKHDVSVQSLLFFLMRGQSTLTQRPIAASSRSRAWRSGFWGVHPNDRSRRPR